MNTYSSLGNMKQKKVASKCKFRDIVMTTDQCLTQSAGTLRGASSGHDP